MGPRAVHLLEAGVYTEQRFAGLGDASAVLAAAFASAIAPAKRVRIPFVPRDRLLTATRESCRTLADAVSTTLTAGATCAILGGECTLVAGALSGALSVEPDLELVYFDAHGDFNTLATTPSHFVGGMCLAHVTGRSVASLLWPGARKIADDRVSLVGARALDPGEAGNLIASRVRRIPFDQDHADAPGLLAAIRRKKVWLHVDVDIVDPREVAAVSFPEPGGPSLASLAALLGQIASVCEVLGYEVCAYDARQDVEEKLPHVLANTIALPLSAVPVSPLRA